MKMLKPLKREPLFKAVFFFSGESNPDLNAGCLMPDQRMVIKTRPELGKTAISGIAITATLCYNIDTATMQNIVEE